MTETRGGGPDVPQQPPAAPEAVQQQLAADGAGEAATTVVPTTGPEGWAAQRRHWRHKRRQRSSSEGRDEGEEGPADSNPGRAQPGAIPLDATYEDLLGGPFRPFTQPIQLKEMVAFLQECWYDEGLYG